MTTRSCIDPKRLRAYNLGTLSPDAAAELETHLSDCDSCQSLQVSFEGELDGLVIGLRQANTGAAVDTVSLRPSTDASAAPVGIRSSSWPTGRIPDSLAEFRRCLVASGLYSPHAARDLKLEPAGPERPGSEKADRPQSDALAAARQLVERGVLTEYQAGELCRGRTDALRLGDYELVEEIGRGGIGCVYRARDTRMERWAAIKFLLPRLDDTEWRERFQREVRALSQLSHPNVVTAYSAGEQGDRPYLAMEFIDGVDLGALVEAHGHLPLGQAVDFTLQAAQGLQAAHQLGIIHRDVKPTNLLVSRTGTVKVSDLGLARTPSTEWTETLTETGQVLGTCDYVSPEQAFQTQPADERSDIYSLGWTLYFLLNGATPWPERSRVEKLVAHRDAVRPALAANRPELPDLLEELFQNMVAPAAEDRPPSMALVRQQLEAARESLPDDAISVPSRPHQSGGPNARDEYFRRLEREIAPRLQQQRQDRLRRIRWQGLAATLLLVAGAALATFLPRVWEPDFSPASRSAEETSVDDATATPVRVDAAVPPPRVVGELAMVNLSVRVLDLQIAQDEQTAFAATEGGWLRTVDLASNEPAHRVHLAGNIAGIQLSPEGTDLAVGTSEPAIHVLDAATLEPKFQIDVPRLPWRMTYSPDGTRLLCAFHRGRDPANPNQPTLQAISVPDGVPLTEFQAAPTAFYWSLQYSPDGETIAVGDQEGQVRLLDAESGQVRETIARHRGPVHALKFSRDGSILYSGGNGGVVLGHRVADGQRVFEQSLRHAIKSIDLDEPSQRMLLGGTIDLRLLDMDETTTEEGLTKLQGHLSPLSGLHFLADGERAVSSSWDGTVRVWMLPD